MRFNRNCANKRKRKPQNVIWYIWCWLLILCLFRAQKGKQNQSHNPRIVRKVIHLLAGRQTKYALRHTKFATVFVTIKSKRIFAVPWLNNHHSPHMDRLWSLVVHQNQDKVSLSALPFTFSTKTAILTSIGPFNIKNSPIFRSIIWFVCVSQCGWIQTGLYYV